MKTCPMAYQISQSRSKFLTKSNKTFKNLPKTLKILDKIAKFSQIWSYWSCLKRGNLLDNLPTYDDIGFQ